MRLLLRPMRHVASADVAREYFLSRDLRRSVDAIFQDAIVPRRPRQQLFFEQRRKGPASQRSEIDGDAEIRLAPITCRRDGRRRFMRMAPVQARNARYGVGSIRGGSIGGGMRQRQRSILIACE